MTYYEKEQRKRFSLGQSGNALTSLLVVSLTFFISMAFMQAIWYFIYEKNQAMAVTNFNKDILSWFVLPADPVKFITRPWTLITHMFVQVGIWSVLGNMLWLWSFGYIMQDITGNKKIIPVFIYGSFAGAIIFMLAYNMVPSLQLARPFAVAMGAIPGIMAIAVATTTITPGYRLFPMLRGGIPLWVLTLLFLVIDSLNLLLTNNSVGLASHLAGATAGYLFIYFIRKGYDGSEWMNNFFDWVGNLFNPDRPRKNKAGSSKGKDLKDELFYKATTKPYTRTPNITQQRIDDILDKINQKGYHFLTDEEKELLKRASQEDL